MKRKKIMFCLIIASLFLCMNTKSSPLYKLNDWYDAQCFFTMGKSMMNGLVPYLDLFEQKGPLLFFIYGIASIISNHSFIGVFILEVISYTIFLYYTDKIIMQFINQKYSYILLPILTVIITASRSFTHGGSCEEFSFPILAIITYYFIKYLKTKEITNKETLIVGIMSGLILWMKYTLLGFSLGFCLIILIQKIKEKKYKELLLKIGYFLLGIVLTSIPWIIYFEIHKGGLQKLIDIYFIFNTMNYSSYVTLSTKIINCLNTIIGVLTRYFQYIILILIPILFSIKTKILFKSKRENIYLLISILLLLILLFLGGTNYRYYSLPMQPYMIFGLIYLMITIDKNKLKNKILKYITPISIITIIICLIISYYRSPNTEYIKYEKKDYAQFIFSEIIEKNKTILNYGFLDGGFYFSTNTYPNTYYFQKNNIKYDLYSDNIDEQRKYVKEKKTDYIIASNKLKNKDKKIIEENYELIATHKQKYEEKIRTYYLYKKIDIKEQNDNNQNKNN